MDNNVTTSEKITKWLLIGISVLFLAIMLLLPLLTVITEALRSGWKIYAAAVTDEYTIKALLLTVKATLFAVIFNTIFGVFAAWALTKFQFRGKKLLTTLIDLPVTISPVIAGLIFLLIFGRQSPVYFFLLKFRNQCCNFLYRESLLATVFCNLSFYFQRADSGSGSRRNGRGRSSSPYGSRRMDHLQEDYLSSY